MGVLHGTQFSNANVNEGKAGDGYEITPEEASSSAISKRQGK
jgi:hypothetical protein